MTIGEYFIEQNEYDCKDCFVKEDGICSGGVSCYGDSITFPFCADLDDEEEELESFKTSFYIGLKEREEFLNEKEKLEKEKELKKKKTREKSLKTKRDTKNFRVMKKVIKEKIAYLEMVKSANSVFSITDKIFNNNTGKRTNSKDIDLTIKSLNKICDEIFVLKKQFLKEYHKTTTRELEIEIINKWNVNLTNYVDKALKELENGKSES